MPVTHPFVSGFVDGGDATKLRPSNWNANHEFTGGTAGQVLTRDTGAADGMLWVSPSGLTGIVPSTRTVNGYALSGNIALVKGDLGLANVDNTSDAGKPISTATQSALDLKATIASPTFTGTITVPAASFTNAALANMATKTYKGRTSAGTGEPEDVGVSTLKSDLGLSLVENTALSTFVSSSALATFVQSGTGALSRMVQAKLRDVVHLDDFAVGDGVTNDATAFSNALNAAAGKILQLGPHRYKIDSAISKAISVTIRGEGKGLSVLDFSAVTSGVALTLSGVLTVLAGTVSGAVAAGAQTFAVSSATGISEADWLLIRPTFIGSGSVAITNGSADVVGTATAFTSQFVPGDSIIINSSSHGAAKGVYVIATITDDTHLALTITWPNPTIASGGSIYNAIDKWNSARNSYFTSEWLRVGDLTGTTVTPEHVMYSAYRSGTPLSRLDPIAVVLQDFTLEADGEVTGLKVINTLQPCIERIKITGARQIGLNIDHCVGARVHDYVCDDVWFSGTDASYGLVGVTVHDFIVDHAFISGGWHAFALGGNAVGGVNRHVTVRDSFFRSDGNYAMDSHGNAEFVYYENNTIVGGMVMSAHRAWVRGNTIWALPSGGSGKTGIAVLLGSDMLSYEQEYSNNTFIQTATPASSNGLFMVASGFHDLGGGSFRFLSNRFSIPSPFTGNIIWADDTGTASVVDGDLVFQGNTFDYGSAVAASATNGAVFIRKNLTGAFRSIVLQNNKLSRCSFMFLGRASDVVVANNISDSSLDHGFAFLQNTSRGITGSFVATGNVVTGAQMAGLYAAPEGTAIVRVAGNRSAGNGQNTGASSGTTSQRVGLAVTTAVTHIEVSNNDLSDTQAVPTQVYGYNIMTAATVKSVAYDNRILGNTNASLIRDVTAAGNKAGVSAPAGASTFESVVTTGNLDVGGATSVVSTGYYLWGSRSLLRSPANGNETHSLFNESIGVRFKYDALPTVASGFGTSPAVTAGSTPMAGSVNVGTGGVATSGVITFGGTAFPSAPFVVCMNTTTGAVVRGVTSTTQLTITAPVAFVASDIVTWICISSR